MAKMTQKQIESITRFVSANQKLELDRVETSAIQFKEELKLIADQNKADMLVALDQERRALISAEYQYNKKVNDINLKLGAHLYGTTQYINELTLLSIQIPTDVWFGESYHTTEQVTMQQAEDLMKNYISKNDVLMKFSKLKMSLSMTSDSDEVRKLLDDANISLV